jgi:hypothetical protein
LVTPVTQSSKKEKEKSLTGFEWHFTLCPAPDLRHVLDAQTVLPAGQKLFFGVFYEY